MKYQSEEMAAHLWRQVHQNTKYFKRKYGYSLDIERPGIELLECDSCARSEEIETEFHSGKDITKPCSFCDNGIMRVY